ncbi:unnamed protein product [Durusdinium trenchii]|uniref:Uncharacterized protein n=1 Tax=Durusdinium trenchii TaxID=1381693 RepID=A0ABP0M3R8_9DINO
MSKNVYAGDSSDSDVAVMAAPITWTRMAFGMVKYKKRGTWFKRPETMLKWLRIKHLLEHHFENLKRAFLEIDTNHSGGIVRAPSGRRKPPVKYEWEAMFGAEGQVKDALAAADLDSNDVFGMPGSRAEPSGAGAVSVKCRPVTRYVTI